MTFFKRLPQAIKNLIAIFTGALVVTLVYAIYNLFSHGLITTVSISLFSVFPVAFTLGILLGLPLYFLIPLSLKKYWYTAALSGLAIGAIPAIIISVVDVSNTLFNYQQSDSERLQDYLLLSIKMVSYAGLLGIIGGISTWKTWCLLGYNFDKFEIKND